MVRRRGEGGNRRRPGLVAGASVGERRHGGLVVRLFDIGFDVDDAGDGEGGANAEFGGVYLGDDGFGAGGIGHGDLCGDEDFFGAEVKRLHVDDAALGVAFEGSADGGDVFAGGGFAQEEGLGFDGEDGGNDDEQDADGGGSGGVPAAVIGKEGEADTDECEDEADECAEVFEENYGEFGGFGGAHEADPGLAALQRH